MPMDYKSSFAASTFKRRLILLMEEKGLSQQAVADYSGVSQGTVSRWISGSRPELENVTSLASKASVPISWLAHGEGTLRIDYHGVDGFIHRVKGKIIPRLREVIVTFSRLRDEPFLSPEETAMFEDIEFNLRKRLSRLASCVDALERLPQEEEGAVVEILSKHYIPMPSETVRGDLCVALGLRGTSSDADIVDACRAALKKNPAPKFGGRAIQSLKKRAKK